MSSDANATEIGALHQKLHVKSVRLQRPGSWPINLQVHVIVRHPRNSM